ncbi:MAG: hypothetical protein Q4G02_02350 [bacterium]|nr:hypothetical protein [bacterium]
MCFEIGFEVWQKIFLHQGLCGVGCLVVKRGDRINLKTRAFGNAEYLKSQSLREDYSVVVNLATKSLFELNPAVACDPKKGYYAAFSVQGKCNAALAQKALTEIIRKENSWGRP